MSQEGWEFWIDVGGTFTDCLARSPEGGSYATKVLSSGLTKGQIDRWEGSDRFFDPERSEGDRFWEGAVVLLLGSKGEVLARRKVVSYSKADGRFELSPVADRMPTGIGHYELDIGRPAPLLAIHQLLDCPLRNPLPKLRVQLGTTRGTNALLTRRGARTALVTTAGLGDLLEIGDQARPNLFALDVAKAAPLCEQAVEIEERVLADGTVEQELRPEAIRQQLQALRDSGIESLAVCLMHSFRYPEHERQVAEIAREVGFEEVRISSEIAPTIKILPRAETTTLDAYLNPVLSRYLDEIASRLSEESSLELMTSAGGLVSRPRFSGKDSVLSGPAGGVVGAARVGEQLGFASVIGFDMGGTSTDVCRYGGNFEIEYETVKAGTRLVTPTLAIETVAAGGGSICWFDGERMRVGPDSAAADPGPACYGRQGPLTITDVNLYLGRIAASHFPFQLHREAVERRLEEVAEALAAAGFERSLTEIAQGFVEIANHEMAAAIRNVSVARGYHPANDVLVSFGGAGAQHCCAVADKLGMEKIIDHPQASLLSAVGIQLAERQAHGVRSQLVEWNDASAAAAAKSLDQLADQAIGELVAEGIAPETVRVARRLDLRYAGTEPCLTIEEEADPAQTLSAFESRHRQFYGYLPDRPVELVAVRVEAVAAREPLAAIELPTDTKLREPLLRQPALWVDDPRGVPLFPHDELQAGDRLIGPAMVLAEFKTTIIDAGWEATVIEDGQLLLEKVGQGNDLPESSSQGSSTSLEVADPIQLEIFNRTFSSIAVRMGEALQRTSASVNVKERLDFSCAVFTREGDLVVNAPHIPVHLGAMSETVRATIRLNESVREGDVFLTNDPYAGGSHLPDVTVISPVFVQEALQFWVASRSHHAELGGIAPGSMPANASCLGEEGVLIQNLKLIDAGQERFSDLEQILTGGKWPSRAPQENLADVRAQVAANRRGAAELEQLVEERGLDVVDRYMRFMHEAAEAKSREAIGRLPDGVSRFADRLDNGAKIVVRLDVSGSELAIDFTGTSPPLSGNLNANRAIVQAAVMYILRCLIDDEIPLNEGVVRPVSVVLPECFLNPSPAPDPAQSPAVVGGNVETSQRVVDVLLGALGLAAASQGTMNNWLMGDETFGYYETVGGGTGATPRSDGADAVHSHMTNTRLTDPEILETRCPVVLRQFAVRRGSGGRGRHSGGHGMIRRIEFCKALRISLLTNRRTFPPYGSHGGWPGKPGRNQLRRQGGEVVILDPQCEFDVHPGDELTLFTPGGGGFGLPKQP